MALLVSVGAWKKDEAVEGRGQGREKREKRQGESPEKKADRPDRKGKSLR